MAAVFDLELILSLVRRAAAVLARPMFVRRRCRASVAIIAQSLLARGCLGDLLLTLALSALAFPALNPRERCPFRLVATAAEDRLS